MEYESDHYTTYSSDAGPNPVAATNKYKQATVEQRTSLNPGLTYVFATLRLNNGGESLMLQRLPGCTTLMMTNRYCRAMGCFDAVESHRKHGPVGGPKSKWA